MQAMQIKRREHEDVSAVPARRMRATGPGRSAPVDRQPGLVLVPPATDTGSAQVTLASVLQNVDQGIAVYDDARTLRFRNARYAEYLNLPPEACVAGCSTLSGILRYLADRGDYGPGDPEAQARDRLLRIEQGPRTRFERRTPSGLWLQASWTALPDAGLAVMLTDITALKATERARANLARHLPPNLVDMLAHEDEPFGPPRAQDVAVLFADIVGFTRLAADEAPEAVFALLREFHGRLTQAVFAYGGTLDEYTGDGLMASFGTPYPSGRDAANALDCARRIVREIEALSRERRARGKPPVQVSVGVHCGPALIGNIGDARRLKFSVVGDTVNVASRLEDLTRELGTTVVASEAVLMQAQREGACVDGFVSSGARQVRGRQGWVSLWTLDARRQ